MPMLGKILVTASIVVLVYYAVIFLVWMNFGCPPMSHL